MKCSFLFFLCFWTASHAAPISEPCSRLAAHDDESHSLQWSMIKMELTKASSSPFTNEAITKTTSYVIKHMDDSTGCAYRYAGISGFFAQLSSEKPETITDIKGDVVTSVSYSNNMAPYTTIRSTLAYREDFNHYYRISLVGVRNHLAVLMLAFVVLGALACSYLRMSVMLHSDCTLHFPVDRQFRAFITSLQDECVGSSDEAALGMTRSRQCSH